jgi:hypothetical protein
MEYGVSGVKVEWSVRWVWCADEDGDADADADFSMCGMRSDLLVLNTGVGFSF